MINLRERALELATMHIGAIHINRNAEEKTDVADVLILAEQYYQFLKAEDSIPALIPPGSGTAADPYKWTTT